MSDKGTPPSAPNTEKSWLEKRWMFVAAIFLGIGIAAIIKKTGPVMEHSPPLRQGVEVATIELKPYEIHPTITGYGEVMPDTVLDSRAEVSGRVTYVHPQLRKGAVLPAGTLVVRIDDRDYQLAQSQAEAALAQSKASLTELQLTLEDARIKLQLAQEKQRLAEQELERKGALLKKGSVSQSVYDTERAALLQQKQEVQNLANQVATLPLQINVQEAQIDKSTAELTTQTRNLERTQIRLPFDARITSLNTEENQFVSQGGALFSAQTIDKVLVNAQFPLEHFRQLIRATPKVNLNPEDLMANGDSATNTLIAQLGLEARVRLVSVAGAEWTGRVEQISNNLDPASRTLGVTIGVDAPYKDIVPGAKPPLVEGMYAEIRLSAPKTSYLVVPRSAINEGVAYLVDSAHKLHRVAISGFAQNEMLLVHSGLEAGQTLVTSDLFPAVEGMLLNPYVDEGFPLRLAQWLEGD